MNKAFYFVAIKVLEGNDNLTYSNKLYTIEEVLNYIDDLRKQDNIKILDISLDKFE